MVVEHCHFGHSRSLILVPASGSLPPLDSVSLYQAHFLGVFRSLVEVRSALMFPSSLLNAGTDHAVPCATTPIAYLYKRYTLDRCLPLLSRFLRCLRRHKVTA